MKSVTGFFVAHRLSTIKKCDRLYVFREGEIVEEGRFDEIIANGAELYKKHFSRSA